MSLVRSLLVPALLLASSVSILTPVGASRSLIQETNASSIERLKTELDRAPKELVLELAKSKDPVAADALIEVYPDLNSLGSRLQLVKALRHFVGAKGCEGKAMQKLLDVASADPTRELRSEAVTQLAKSGPIGREYLGILIESPADAGVRIEAMREHIRAADKDSFPFYRRLLGTNQGAGAGQEGGQGEQDSTRKLGPPLQAIRNLAAIGLMAELTDEELSPRAFSNSRSVREAAQREIYRRGGKLAEELAEGQFVARGELISNRVLAAEYLIKNTEDAGAVFEELVETGGHRESSARLRRGFADLYAKTAPDDLKTRLVRQAGKGKLEQKLFSLQALQGFSDEKGKLDRAILKMVSDKELEVRELASEAAAERRIDGAAKAIEVRLDKAKDSVEAAGYLRALTRLHGQDVAWRERLQELSSDERSAVRNAAIRAIVDQGGTETLATIEKALAHEDWSTRLLAVKAIEERRDSEAVGWLVAALDSETGRMKSEITDALVRLTGQSFRSQASIWARWWADNEDGFEAISEAEWAKMEEDAEARRLEDTTSSAEFFGLKLDSQRLVFVIDASGSMELSMAGRYVGEQGAQRIEAARTELVQALDKLDPEALFGVIPFNDRARPIQDELVRASKENLGSTKKDVLKLQPSGGTNLFGGLKAAFELSDTDTIVLLGDGIASMGETVDPDVIRMRVARWNKDRGVKIHAVAIGADIQVLRWLAEDSGGQHIFLP